VLVVDADGRPATMQPLEDAIARLACAISNPAENGIECLIVDPARRFRSQHLDLPAPVIVRLPAYLPLATSETERVTKRVLFARDGFRCAYCELQASPANAHKLLTVDHVKPACRFPSRAAATFWENVVTACAPCNRAKADRLPWQFKLPSVDPRRPNAVQLRFAGRVNGVQRDYVRAFFALEDDVAL
jgi:5-methylcytosine-specific restriction endonuclease McrA